jgi:hypothetical protein
MNHQLKTTFTSILLAIKEAAASGVVAAGKGGGNGGGGGSGSGNASTYGPGNGSMYSSASTTGYGDETRNSNQYRHQHQHQYRKGNGGQAADYGTGQFIDDKYLNQQDFQAWLNQSQHKTRNQNHNQVQNMAQDGL